MNSEPERDRPNPVSREQTETQENTAEESDDDSESPEYERVSLDEVNETGYGVVVPSMEEMTLEDPEIVKHIKELLKLCKDDNDKLFHYKKNGEVKKTFVGVTPKEEIVSQL